MAELDTDVLIVGAGPTGLLLADELELAGVRTVVVERDEAPSTQTKALNLQPRTSEIMDWRGRLAAMEQLAFARIPGGHFSGIPLKYGVLDTRFPYQLGVRQPDVVRVLEEELEHHGTRVRRGVEFVGIERGAAEADDHVTVTVSGQEGLTRLRARYLVGADGARSSVRRALGVDFTGQEPRRDPMVVCDLTLPGYAHPTGKPLTPTFEPGVPYAFITPLRDGLFRFAYESSVPGIAHDAEVTADEVQQVLTREYGPQIRLGELRAGSRYTDATRQAAKYRVGRVFLAGDASHIHTPMGGQGMNLGLQDAFNLGWKLAAAVRGWAPAGLLDTYHSERHPVGAEVLADTRAQNAISSTDVDAPAVRATLVALLALPEANYYQAARTAGLTIRYDLGDGLGHRAPDVDLGDATRLAEHAREGHGILLDTTPDHRFDTLAGKWRDRVRYVRGKPGIRPEPTPAVLIRPDGYECGAGDHVDALQAALETWFGPAGR